VNGSTLRDDGSTLRDDGSTLRDDGSTLRVELGSFARIGNAQNSL
jgi:hypothetical protein